MGRSEGGGKTRLGGLMAHVLVSALTLAPHAAAGGGSILAPVPQSKGPDISLVFLHGAACPPEAYEPLAQAIQHKLRGTARLWVGLPEVLLANPKLNVSEVVGDMEARMKAGGMAAKLHFIAGHSLGAVRAQEFAKENPKRLDGQVLMGAVLLRKDFNGSVPFPVPTLTVGGEKDGMMRVSRLAEAAHSSRSYDANRYPVVVVPGMNHMGSAAIDPPLAVKLRDLKSEITAEAARDAIASAVADFIGVTAGGKPTGDLAAALKTTATLVDPLIEAMQLEGTPHLQRPCNSDHPSPHCPFYPAWPLQESRTPSTDTDCTCGCRWVQEVAQAHIGGLESHGVKFSVVDAYHDVRDTKPYHHAHLWNNCSQADVTAGRCTLNVTTVTMLIYPRIDDADTGVTPNTASELRTKMISRQRAYQNTIDPNAQLSMTDSGSFCAEINERALQWALKKAPPRTADRYNKLGVQMVFDEDIRHKIQIGPVWIYSPLKMKQKKDGKSGKWQLHVQSTTMVTDVTAHIYPDSAGYHYCKLLSPARALEWVYVDSLRRYDGVHGKSPDDAPTDDHYDAPEEEKECTTADILTDE